MIYGSTADTQISHIFSLVKLFKGIFKVSKNYGLIFMAIVSLQGHRRRYSNVLQ